MRRSLGLLYAALAVFLLSAGLTLVALERTSRVVMITATLGMVLSASLFLLSIWRPRGPVDWERIRAEQRLWESGPIGRSWLRVRRRLYDRWKM